MEERRPELISWVLIVGGSFLLLLIIPLLYWYFMYLQIVLTTAFFLGTGVVVTMGVRQIAQNIRLTVQSILGVRENFEKIEKMKLANERERERLAFDRLMQPLVIEALSQGKNFEYSSKGDIRISDWKSNVHTMPSVEQATGYSTPMLTQPGTIVESSIEENSYMMSPGIREDTGEPLVVSFKGRHLKYVGTSQMGKSSLICLLLDQILSSHSPENVQLASLDLEGLNSNLFRDRPHMRYLAQIELKPIVEGMTWAVGEMNKRYELGMKGMASSPLLLVYIEEYLDLVNQLKLYDKELFKQFTTNMTTLAVRGLKANIVLWASMQTNYSEDQLKEALANIPYGHCMGLNPNAGRAAGFPDNDLLKENFKRAMPGTSYARYPEFKGLITHHPYDIKGKLRQYEEGL